MVVAIIRALQTCSQDKPLPSNCVESASQDRDLNRKTAMFYDCYPGFLLIFFFFLLLLPLLLSERVPEAVAARVQGGGREEVTFHPAPLQHLQGHVGLADPAGHLLRGHHRAVQRLLHCRGDPGRRPLSSTQPSQRQRYPGGDTLHHRYVLVFVCFGAFVFSFIKIWDYTVSCLVSEYL